MYEKLACKGFISTPRYDIEGKVIYGTIDEIDGFASYEAKRAAEVETAFRNAVDDYIDACEESGVDPNPRPSRFSEVATQPSPRVAAWFRPN